MSTNETLKESPSLQEVPQSTSFGSQDAPIDLDPLEISDEDIKVTTNKNTEVTSKWNALFTPKPIPNCNVHGEPCKQYKVNKPGPNRGRRFYLCSRYFVAKSIVLGLITG